LPPRDAAGLALDNEHVPTGFTLRNIASDVDSFFHAVARGVQGYDRDHWLLCHPVASLVAEEENFTG